MIDGSEEHKRQLAFELNNNNNNNNVIIIVLTEYLPRVTRSKYCYQLLITVTVVD